MIGDLLIKLNKGERLQPAEEQELRLWGNQTQLNNAYVGGLQNGSSDISCLNINARRISVQREIMAGLAARYQNIGLSVATNTYVDSSSWVADYADAGFRTSGIYIYIPETGRYQISFQVSWDESDPTTLAGIRDTGAKTNGVPSRPQANGGFVDTDGYTYINAFDEVEYRKGDAINFTHWQNSGVTITLDIWVVIRKLR